MGADALGAQLEQTLLARGVASFVRRDPGVRTGSSVVLTYANGRRHFISSQPNNAALAFADIDLAMLAGGGHLLRADVWFSPSMLAGGNAQLLQAARDRGLATSLDLNWDPCWGAGPEELIQSRKKAVRRILPLVDLVHGNTRELNLFADSTDLTTTLQRLAAWGAGAVVLHMGAAGAGYCVGGKLLVEPSALVERQVNATGSGDLLSACIMLLHGRSEIPVSARLRLANRIVAQFIEGKRDFLPKM